MPAERSAVAHALRQVAHDLRTPLGSLALWLRMARADERELAATSQALAMVEDAALALTRFARDLGDAAQFVEGGLRLERASLELRALLAEVLDFVRPRALARQVALGGPPWPEPVHVVGDRERLGRALEVLVEQAVARAPKGGSAEVGLTVLGARARIAIAPAGLGPRALPSLERWFSAQAPTGGRPRLSLALARHLLEAQGAVLELGKHGATLQLPLASHEA